MIFQINVPRILPALLLTILSLVSSLAQTPAELKNEVCAGYRESDRKMSETYREVLSFHKGETNLLAAIREEQRIWTMYRAAQMKTAFTLKRGETVKERYDEFYLTCRCENLEKLTVERLNILRGMLSDANTLDDGNVCGTCSTREAQSQIIEFPTLDVFRVSAVETLKEPLRLVFSDPVTGREKASFNFQRENDEEAYRPFNFHSPGSPLLRFKTIYLDYPDNPLIFAVAIQPGGSDHGFRAQVIGAEDDKKLKVFTPELLSTAIVGGIHFGDLGANRGMGLAVWNYIWDDNEGHSGPHVFEVQMYPYDKNKKMFVKGEKLTTKNKYDDERAALNELKLSFFVDQLSLVPGIESYREKN